MTHQEDAINDILLERDRQDQQWGVQKHHPAYWLAIMGKQVGQFGSAILDREWWTTSLRAKATQKMRDEAVQMAAVAVAIIECIDAGDMPVGLVTAKPDDPRQLATALGRGDEIIDYSGEPETALTDAVEDDIEVDNCYHCGLEIVWDPPGNRWVHRDQEAYAQWLHCKDALRSGHAARYAPGCTECGRDNVNGTHDALRSAGHLDHNFNPPMRAGVVPVAPPPESSHDPRGYARRPIKDVPQA